MKKAIAIIIPDECHESWDTMSPAPSGRHCAQCNKTVIDFTSWGDAALYDFFTKPRSGICGNFHEDQLMRPIVAPPQPHSALYRMAMALGLTVLMIPATDIAFAQAPLKHSHGYPAKAPKKKTASDTISITGIVLDSNSNRPIANVRVDCLVPGKMQLQSITLADGTFNISLAHADSFRLIFSDGSFVTVEKSITNASPEMNMGHIYLQKSELVNNNVNSNQIRRLGGATQTADLVSLSPGIYQRRGAPDVNQDPGRSSGNIYVVDSVSTNPVKHKKRWLSWLWKRK